MLFDQIKADLTASMKAGTSLRTSVLRMLLSELNYKHIDLQRDLVDEDVQAALAKEAKKRREAIEAYTAGGRAEQAESEKQELEILQTYLPKQLTEQEVRVEVTKRLSDEEIKDFGAAMKVVSPMFKGRADGQMVARIVKETLGV